MSGGTEPGVVYRERAARFREARDRVVARSRTLARTRLAVFLGGVVLFLLAESAGGLERLAYVGATAVAALAFVALVGAHARVRARAERLEVLGRINEEGTSRIERRWDALPPTPPEGDPLLPPPDHPYAADLDLFGRASLFRLFSTVSTRPGRATLAGWLLGAAPPAEIPARQEAVGELAPLLDLRDEVAADGRAAEEGPPHAIERFLEWAEDEPWLSRIRWLRLVSWLVPLLTTGLLVLHLGGWMPYALWVVPLAATGLLHRRLAPRVTATFDRASTGEGGIRSYAPLLERLASASFESPALREAREALVAEGVAAHRKIRRLRRLLDMSDLRFSMFHLPIHFLTLWDFHVLMGMERWQREAGGRARGWLDAMGRLDALSAIGALAHDHPEWTFPEITQAVPGHRVARDAQAPAGPERPTRPRIEARALGHPLLPPSRCVTNDVDVGPPGTFLLVTGSNMSGKSTLLRAIGVNAVLAQSGAPVCAASLRLPPLAVHTSMRVSDSLEAGLSHFMAELLRLKDVVEAARASRERGGPPLLYLLDELLQGTNTAERRIAARTIVGHLIDVGAIGAVTTHDLSLADAPELQRRAQAVHFREQVDPAAEGPALTFDYRLRPGLATSRNALELMRIVGLEVPPETGT